MLSSAIFSSDWKQQRRHEKNMEPQIHSEESFWWDSGSDLPSRGARPDHRFRRPHAQDVEPPKDRSCQKVRMPLLRHHLILCFCFLIIKRTDALSSVCRAAAAERRWLKRKARLFDWKLVRSELVSVACRHMIQSQETDPMCDKELTTLLPKTCYCRVTTLQPTHSLVVIWILGSWSHF